MASYMENAYSMVHQDNAADVPSLQDLKNQLERGTDEAKVETMKRILVMMLNGSSLEGLLMHIIRFVMPSKSKALKKLLYMYYEICPKHDASGKLKQEMILVCNGIRFDLLHANEFIRGNTLRFLCKLREAELLEPLLSSTRQCLDHRHAYVRKNAVMAVASIFQHSEEVSQNLYYEEALRFAHSTMASGTSSLFATDSLIQHISDHTGVQSLIPDAPELIQNFLAGESDTTCKRNAFAALMTISHEKALSYISNTFDGIPNVDELLQLVEIEFIRRDAVQNAANKARYLRLIFDLLEAGTSTVAYEAATALTALTSNPVAIKAAATKLIELCVKEADNNVKLIVLDKVETLRQQHGLDDSLTMEVLRVLTSPDLDVRKKALGIALELVSSKNIDEMLLLLRKELQKSTDSAQEKADEYRQLLIRTISQCAIQYPAASEGVVDTLVTFIADNNAGAIDVISFLKEVCETMPKLRPSILEKLAILSDVRSGKVQRGVLWLVSEYSSTETEIRNAWQRIRAGLGEIPILQSENRLLEEANEQDGPEEQVNGHSQSKPAKTRLAADGTYQSESALTAKLETVKAAQKPPLRQLILEGDYFFATVLASSLVKLVMRLSETSAQQEVTNALRSEAMLILVSIIRVGQSHFVKAPIDEDSVDRIMSSVHVLAEFSEWTALKKALLDDTRQAFRAIVQVEEKKRAEKAVFEKQKTAVGVDDLFSIRQLAKKSEGQGTDEIGLDLDQAMGGDSTSEDLTSKLSRVVQLTGFSDPVYAEAYVKVHQFDIVLDVLLVNQTNETLQNLSVEFATLGDLKVVERPTTQNLGPRDFLNVQSTIKVSSTDTGVIFGNVVYDSPSGTDTHVVILNDVHADIMDYIQPATCSETAFRTMWTEFEWENKVNINKKNAGSLREFLDQLMKSTNMSCLTPEAGLKGDCQFLSANLYAKSVFGEDALANLSIEKEGENGPITGFVRIRSRSQGLALSLGSLKGLKAGTS